jgi:hypothetical protein
MFTPKVLEMRRGCPRGTRRGAIAAHGHRTTAGTGAAHDREDQAATPLAAVLGAPCPLARTVPPLD